MIERSVPGDDPFGLLEDEVEVEVEPVLLADDEGEVGEDGSITFNVAEEEKSEELDPDHSANLAVNMDKEKLLEIAREITEVVESDKAGRKEWEDAYTSGLDYLGIKEEKRTKPWNGASGVFHPLLMEAVVRFQSQAMQEIYPPAGPAKTRILGKDTAQNRALAIRVQDELNYQLTQKMPEYRGETERLLFRLALVGSCFRKIYFDPMKKRPRSMFVPAEDFLVPYGESDLAGAERFTHILRLSKNEMKKMQAAGLYREVEMSDPTFIADEIEDKKAEITGVEPNSPGSDRYVVYEVHMDLDLGEGEIALPYVVCMDESTETILSIRRNWKEDEEGKERCSWFVSYEYVPGLGFYGLGLIHLIGGIAKSVTSIQRQLIDAGTLANLPGGLKSRDLRIKGDDTPIRPGEFRDVDVPSGKVSDAITFLPYKEPSGVLYQLLQQLVEEGRRVGSIAEIDVGDMSGEAPVGTTLALLERAQKVMSAVQARLHASLAKELKMIACIIREDMPPEYDYNPGNDKQRYDRRKDFSQAAVEIVPVSDPGATTMSQRVVQHQAAIQMASQAPQLYDMPKLHRIGLEILGIKDAAELVPSAEEMKPSDPVSENMAILQGKPVSAFISQDHEAHLAVHMAAAQDPKMQQLIGQSPNAASIGSAMQAHLAEHLGFLYRSQIEQQMGTALPPPGEPLPPEVEAQIARAAVPAAQALLQKHQQEQAQQEAAAIAQDPLVQLQAKELALEQAKIENKAANDAAKLELSAKQGEVRAMVEVARIAATQTNTERSALLEAARSAEELRLEGQRIAALARDKGNEGA
jgi:hypothetical protein